MFETVLIPLNLRESPQLVERVAAALAAYGAESIILLHVQSSPQPSRRSAELDRHAEELRQAGYRCRVLQRSGSVAPTVVLTAAEEGCSLIAYPWRYKSWIQRSLVGSVTKDIVRLSDRPVFVYKPARVQSSRTEGDLNGPVVMYATDFRDTDSVVIPYLTARLPDTGSLLLLHAGERAPDPAAEGRRLARVNAALERLATECREPGHTVTTASVVGRPRTAVVRQAQRNRVDVLVIGKADSERALATVLGSTAESIAYNARCSVLIIPRTATPEEL